jgi:hypothetical protein
MKSYANKKIENEIHSVAGSSAGKRKTWLQLKDNRPPSVLQAKLVEALAARKTPSPIQRLENKTGLPGQLKSGIENLSGYSMDDVNVHYNSSKPAQLNAHAYAQGTDIHIAPGREKHLPHEAWHVVQQKQGRVYPTVQMKGKYINDDRALENEADLMGAKAQQKATQRSTHNFRHNAVSTTLFNRETTSIQRTLIRRGDTPVPGTSNENTATFLTSFVLDTMSKTLQGKITYIDYLISRFNALEKRSAWDDEMILRLEGLKFGFTEELQEANKTIVLEAVKLALSKIASANDRIPDQFKPNLARIDGYLQAKAANYDEGHFLCSPEKDGNNNELAHSKANGDIELFRGFFEAGSSRRADLLVHEAVHSVLHVPDYAYMWQPIFRFLPIQTQLVNPDSYVAALNRANNEAVETPDTGHDVNDRVLGMMQHVCMRGIEIMNVCENQLPQFDAPPQPLFTLKNFRPNYSEVQLRTLIGYAKNYGSRVSGLIVGKKIIINHKNPAPISVDAATAVLAGGVITVDYINSEKSFPFVAILARIFNCLGLELAESRSLALTLNALADQRHMSSTTLLPSGV